MKWSIMNGCAMETVPGKRCRFSKRTLLSTQGCIIRSILPSGMGARGEHGDVFLFSNLGAL